MTDERDENSQKDEVENKLIWYIFSLKSYQFIFLSSLNSFLPSLITKWNIITIVKKCFFPQKCPYTSLSIQRLRCNSKPAQIHRQTIRHDNSNIVRNWTNATLSKLCTQSFTTFKLVIMK